MVSPQSKEFQIIDKYFKRSLSETNGNFGIGDDTSVLSLGSQEKLLTTTDHMVEGVHFNISKISPWQLGWKVLAVSLSDIAAMGGQPIGCFLNLALPTECLASEFLKKFSEGFFTLADKYSIPLLGGDTTRSPQSLFAGTTVLGLIDPDCIKLRSGAKPEDVIALCGNVGDSHLGLLESLGQLSLGSLGPYFLRRHYEPRPLVNEGIWFGQQKTIHGMMDLSDGLPNDLGHMCRESDLGALVHIDRIPLSKKAKEICDGELPVKKQSLFFEGGEDYSLLLAIDPDDFQNIKVSFESIFEGKTLIDIGKFNIGSTEKEKQIQYFENGQSIPNPSSGFQHF